MDIILALIARGIKRLLCPHSSISVKIILLASNKNLIQYAAEKVCDKCGKILSLDFLDEQFVQKNALDQLVFNGEMFNEYLKEKQISFCRKESMKEMN
jgi:hypothetical protein